MIHPETAYRYFHETFAFDMTSGHAGYSAYETCDAWLKALIASQESFTPERGVRYFLSSVDGLYIRQKEAEQYGLALSYNALKGLFSLETRFGFSNGNRTANSDISLEEALLFSDTVEETIAKVSVLLPPDWEDRIVAVGGSLDRMEDFSGKPVTVLEFIERQINSGTPEEIVIVRTAGMLTIRKDIVSELYDHVKILSEGKNNEPK